MATKIKLMRLGKMRAPHYRIVVADARTKRDGRAIESIGLYHPKEDPSFIEVNSDRALYWLGVGAQPTAAVEVLLKLTGDWQKFKGEDAPPPLKVKEPKAARPEIGTVFAESDKANEDGKGSATTPKKRAPKKDDKAAEKAAEPAAPAAEA
ncbi:30S ribosomal protein S16 [Fodinicola feengrottensis]|uniref:Small ribosomal subunit protein bS16 n=1 Tax=Fodinicola feengrottensis TaxID=435914 RepID=A0ABP4T4F4_9ACTN